MKIEEAKQLSNGIYRLYWKDGGTSIAAVGRLHNGTPWFAPINWVSATTYGIASKHWRLVNSVKFIMDKGE